MRPERDDRVVVRRHAVTPKLTDRQQKQIADALEKASKKFDARDKARDQKANDKIAKKQEQIQKLQKQLKEAKTPEQRTTLTAVGSLGRIVKARLMSPFVGHRLRPFLSITKREDLLDLIRLVEAGKLTPIVGKAYSLADTGLAIEHAGSGHARSKVVITP